MTNIAPHNASNDFTNGFRTALRLSLVSIATVASACSVSNGENDIPPANTPLMITDATATKLLGTFVHGDSIVEFQTELRDAKSVIGKLEVNGAVIDFDFTVGRSFNQNGYSASIELDDKKALLAFSKALGIYAESSRDNSLHLDVLMSQAGWISEAPVGLTMQETNITLVARARGLGNELDCLQDGGLYTAHFDEGDNGKHWEWQRSAGGDNCLGRCGPGCNWLDTDLFRDCFEHDSCVALLGGGSTDPFDENCGDEWINAIDDYAASLGPVCY